jgi:hypothetical protein
MYFVTFINPSVFFYFCYEIKAKDRRYFVTFPYSAHYLACRWRRVVGYAPIPLIRGKSHLNRRLDDGPENRSGHVRRREKPVLDRPARTHSPYWRYWRYWLTWPFKEKGFRRKLQALTRWQCLHNATTVVSRGGVRLSLLGTAATNWPIVPAPDDRLWTWSSRWNGNWQGKPKYSEKTCPSATLTTTNPTWPDLGSNPSRRGGKPATNHLSSGTAYATAVTLLCSVSTRFESETQHFLRMMYFVVFPSPDKLRVLSFEI